MSFARFAFGRAVDAARWLALATLGFWCAVWLMRAIVFVFEGL